MKKYGKLRFQDTTCDHLVSENGCGAKNMALLQNQCEHSQFGQLINLITGKIVQKGNNFDVKLRKYYFCTTTVLSPVLPTYTFVGSVAKNLAILQNQ
jgi:hypothetical protein